MMWDSDRSAPKTLIQESLRCNHPYAHYQESDKKNDRDSYIQHGIDHGVLLPPCKRSVLDVQEMAGTFKQVATIEMVATCLKT